MLDQEDPPVAEEDAEGGADAVPTISADRSPGQA